MTKQYLQLAEVIDASTKTTGFERNCASAIRALTVHLEALQTAYATLDATACADRHIAELAQDNAAGLLAERDALQARVLEMTTESETFSKSYGLLAVEHCAALEKLRELEEQTHIGYVDGDEVQRRILWNVEVAAFDLPVGTLVYARPVPAAPTEQAPPAKTLSDADADMFWDAENGESFGRSVEDIIGNYAPGEVVGLHCAKSLPGFQVRCIAPVDEESDMTWEVVEAALKGDA